jgi:hypothetical protein
MIRLVALAALASCAYDAGSFVADGVPFTGHGSTVGCIDIAVALGTDRVATGVVVDYTFANRCARAVAIDLSSIRAVAINIDVTTTPLTTFDPRGELRPLWLDGGAVGHESIEYDGLVLVDPETAKAGAYGRQALATGLTRVMAQLDAAERQIAANGERELEQARAAISKAPHADAALALRAVEASIEHADAEATQRIEAARAEYRTKLAPQPCKSGDRVIAEAHAAIEVCLDLGRIDLHSATLRVAARACLAMRGYSITTTGLILPTLPPAG